MMILITYDVSTKTPEGRYRLRQVAKRCVDYGQRVQNSVFECSLDPAQWTMLRRALLEVINADEDSLRFYFLGANWQKRVEHHGAKSTYDPGGPLIV
jgi:CRISPR-associated protein Cas2